MINIGAYEIHAIEAGRFRLDGGAMFGVVPKVLWDRLAPADDLNRIRLAMRCMLAIDRHAGRVILVDCGTGSQWNEKELDRYAFETQGDPLGAGLRRHGLTSTDVTDVIISHLHFDHNGGLTDWNDPTKPRFPNARHWTHKKTCRARLRPDAERPRFVLCERF